MDGRTGQVVNHPAVPEGKQLEVPAPGSPDLRLVAAPVLSSARKSLILWGGQILPRPLKIPGSKSIALLHIFAGQEGVSGHMSQELLPTQGGRQPSLSPPQAPASDPRGCCRNFPPGGGGWFPGRKGRWEPCQEGDHCVGACPLMSGRGAQMESVCPKIIAHVGGCLLSAQFSSLETGRPSPGCPRERRGAASCPGVAFQVRQEGPSSPPLGNDSTLKGYKHRQLHHLSGLTGLDRYQRCAEEEAGQEVK